MFISISYYHPIAKRNLQPRLKKTLTGNQNVKNWGFQISIDIPASRHNLSSQNIDASNAATHSTSEVDSSESIFPTSNWNASLCMSSGKRRLLHGDYKGVVTACFPTQTQCKIKSNEKIIVHSVRHHTAVMSCAFKSSTKWILLKFPIRKTVKLHFPVSRFFFPPRVLSVMECSLRI